MGSTRPISWQAISRAVGLTIVLVLFLFFCISTITPRVTIDRTMALSFLGIASALIGIPSGYRLVSRSGPGNGEP